MSKGRANAQIQPSLAGFNTSKRADRSSVGAFIKSYAQRFPANAERAYNFILEDAAFEWVQKMITKGVPAKIQAQQARQVTPKTSWVPRNEWIPNNPSPRASYKHEATNIAKSMRKQLDEREHDGI